MQKVSSSLSANESMAYIIRKQAEIEQRLARCEQAILECADKIDELANKLSYPINSIHVTREQLREIAAVIRVRVRGERHG